MSKAAPQTAVESRQQDVLLTVIASLIDTNGNFKSKALFRKQAILAALTRKLLGSPEFASLLTEAEAELIVRASVLQDIGNSDVPDKVLLKPGKLTTEEYDLVKKHPKVGYDALKEVERLLGEASPFLRYAQEIAFSHQEKWDGSGYPQQLRGDAIPLSARLTAIVDVYNAIISRRVYKQALTHSEAIQIIRDLRDKDFDPRITDAFLAISKEVEALAKEYADYFDQQAEINRLATSAAEEITL